MISLTTGRPPGERCRLPDYRRSVRAATPEGVSSVPDTHEFTGEPVVLIERAVTPPVRTANRWPVALR
ncbi:hypothetical protein PSU4_03420 [Pseudonocardia sulfidoxydans NBRC 16205]|uniref:Uncharacterized protein n=1 Tax=Pseudonocardia sulfidoxydans NBRC 16205 TaxID=1223511 RepID=A0A511DEI9_9PSEU|nr:hypothetical protein PSU4_03420 [Pseudonocardia sulfidoxydans NBRC 16205]